MESNNVIIGLLVLIVLLLIVGIGLLIMNDNQDTNLPPVNNTTNDTNEVINATVESSSDSTQSQSSNSPKHYDDWQKDYETGEYDEFGSPIYRSVISTSGGQNEPGIYEAYWSENGPISEKRIG